MPQPRAKTISFEDIQKYFVIPADLNETELFLQGDHWQEQAGWIGWQPESKSTTAQNDWRLIHDGFTPKNVIGGMVKRLTGAIFGKEPDWEVVSAEDTPELAPDEPVPPPTPEQKRFKEMDAVVTEWWTEKKVHKVLKQFIRNKAAYGKAALRIYIPAGYMKKGPNGNFTLDVKNPKDLAEVLSRIFVDAPHYSTITDAPDPSYGTMFTILQADKPVDDETLEVTGEKIYELCFVDNTDGRTYLRHVEQGTVDKGNVSRSIDVDLGGNLLTYVDGQYSDALISRPVKQQQKQLNHANTMEGYAIANINFPPTYFTNAVTEVETRGANGKPQKGLAQLLAGFGQWIGLVGIKGVAADGSDDIKTPGVIFQPTGDPEKFAKVAKNKAADMHEEAGMLYVFLADSPYPSGESRVEAMTDYLILLVDYKTLCDNVGSWLLTSVLRLAFNFMGTAKQDNDKFKVLFSTKLTIGRISTDDKRVMLEEVTKGLRSKRNYMITTEVSDDPETELKVVKAETPAVDESIPPGKDDEVRPRPGMGAAA